MRVGIKYCGGCNPIFNRKEFVLNLMDKHKDVLFESAMENTCYDIVLVINGCLRACANHEKLKGRKRLVINSDHDFNNINEIINRLKNNS